MDILRNTNIDFMKYRKFWIGVSVALVVLGLVSLFAPVKLNLGIDFAGGTQLTVKLPQTPAIEEIRAVVESTGARDVQIQRYGAEADNEVLIRTAAAAGSEEGTAAKVTRALRARDAGITVLATENVGPQVGAELSRKGLLAVGWSLAGMLAYIAFRFELHYGIGATMATVHDVLVTVGLFTLFGFEWNLTTIAAFLTLIGYSVNDTVVTFDRTRENLRRSRGEALIAVMNRSINQTLSRTILTGGTVILAAAALLLRGGEVLRGFAFILFVGVIVGTYSSIYVASPFALLWASRRGQPGAPVHSKTPLC